MRGLHISAWQGIRGPARLPRGIVNRIYTGVTKLLRQPDTVARLGATGTEQFGSTLEQFAALIQRELKEFGKAIKTAHITAE